MWCFWISPANKPALSRVNQLQRPRSAQSRLALILFRDEAIRVVGFLVALCLDRKSVV